MSFNINNKLDAILAFFLLLGIIIVSLALFVFNNPIILNSIGILLLGSSLVYFLLN